MPGSRLNDELFYQHNAHKFLVVRGLTVGADF